MVSRYVVKCFGAQRYPSDLARCKWGGGGDVRDGITHLETCQQFVDACELLYMEEGG